MYVYIYISVYLYQSIYLSLSVYLFIYLSIYQSIYLFIYLFKYRASVFKLLFKSHFAIICRVERPSLQLAASKKFSRIVKQFLHFALWIFEHCEVVFLVNFAFCYQYHVFSVINIYSTKLINVFYHDFTYKQLFFQGKLMIYILFLPNE